MNKQTNKQMCRDGQAEQRAKGQPPANPSIPDPPEDLDGEALEIWCLLDEEGHRLSVDQAQKLTEYLKQFFRSPLHYVEERTGRLDPFADNICERFDDTPPLLRALCEDASEHGNPELLVGRNDFPDDPEDPSQRPRETLAVNHDTEVWQRAVELLADRMDAEDHEAWIQTLGCAGVSADGDLVLVADDEFFVDWIEDNYIELIRQAVTDAARRPTPVRLEDESRVDIQQLQSEGAA